MRAADRLRAAKAPLLESWAARVRERLPPARHDDPLALVDSLPAFIDGLVEALGDRAPREALDRLERSLAAEHGRDRAGRPQWSLGQVVEEYQLLRQVVFEVLETRSRQSVVECPQVEGGKLSEGRDDVHHRPAGRCAAGRCEAVTQARPRPERLTASARPGRRGSCLPSSRGRGRDRRGPSTLPGWRSPPNR